MTPTPRYFCLNVRLTGTYHLKTGTGVPRWSTPRNVQRHNCKLHETVVSISFVLFKKVTMDPKVTNEIFSRCIIFTFCFVSFRFYPNQGRGDFVKRCKRNRVPLLLSFLSKSSLCTGKKRDLNLNLELLMITSLTRLYFITKSFWLSHGKSLS